MDLNEKYQAIDHRGRQLLLRGGDIDPWLSDLEDDFRHGMSLIFTLPAHVSRNIGFALGKLREVEPDQYYYPAKDMHVTVIDLIKATPEYALSTEQEQAYLTAVRQAVKKIAPFRVSFQGLITSGSAVMVKGLYQPGLAELRQAVRHQVEAAGLQLQERYQQTTAHVTVARQQAPLVNTRRDLAVLDSLAEVALGTALVDQVELVVHDWYNRQPRLLAKLEM